MCLCYDRKKVMKKFKQDDDSSISLSKPKEKEFSNKNSWIKLPTSILSLCFQMLDLKTCLCVSSTCQFWYTTMKIPGSINYADFQFLSFIPTGKYVLGNKENHQSRNNKVKIAWESWGKIKLGSNIDRHRTSIAMSICPTILNMNGLSWFNGGSLFSLVCRSSITARLTTLQLYYRDLALLVRMSKTVLLVNCDISNITASSEVIPKWAILAPKVTHLILTCADFGHTSVELEVVKSIKYMFPNLVRFQIQHILNEDENREYSKRLYTTHLLNMGHPEGFWNELMMTTTISEIIIKSIDHSREGVIPNSGQDIGIHLLKDLIYPPPPRRTISASMLVSKLEVLELDYPTKTVYQDWKDSIGERMNIQGVIPFTILTCMVNLRILKANRYYLEIFEKDLFCCTTSIMTTSSSLILPKLEFISGMVFFFKGDVDYKRLSIECPYGTWCFTCMTSDDSYIPNSKPKNSHEFLCWINNQYQNHLIQHHVLAPVWTSLSHYAL